MARFPRRGRRRPGRFTPRLESLEDRTLLSIATWTGAKDSAWSNPNNWREGFVPAANDTAVFDDTASNFHVSVDSFFTAGTVGALVVTWHDPNAVIELDRPLSVGMLYMDRGTITGPAGLTIGGGVWSGGVWSPSQVTILAGSRFAIGGSDLKVLQCNVNNFGATRWTGDGAIESDQSSLITFDNRPGAAFEIDNDSHWYENGTAAFINEGLFRKVNSAGTSTFDISFNNLKTSNLELFTGTLSMTGGGKTVAPVAIAAGAVLQDSADYTLDGAIITGDGIFQKTGDGQIFVIKSVQVDNFEFDGGQLGYIGNLEIRQSFTWTGGTIVGEIDIDAAATMSISGDGTKAVKYDSLINNSGTVTWTGAGAIDLDGVFTNQRAATFDVQTDAEIYSLGNGRFNNLGTLLKSAGDGTTPFALMFANAGLVEGLTGTIELYRGMSTAARGTNDNAFFIDDQAMVDLFDFTLDGTSITGAGVLREVEGGQTKIVGEVSASNVELNDGILATTAGDLTISDNFTWTRGTITGSGGYAVVIGASGTMTILGPSARVLSGNLTNYGTIDWLSTGNLDFIPGSILTNAPGAFFVAETTSGLTSQGTFQNQGTFQMDQGPGATILIDITFINTGTLVLGSGTISLGKPFNNMGTVIVGDGGTLSVGGNYIQGAGVTDLRGGILSATTTLSIQANGLVTGWGIIEANVVNAGQLSLGEGDLAGTLTTTGDYTQTATGVLNLKIGGTSMSDFDQLVVQGAATLDDAGATLNVSLFNNFNPDVGETFAVMSFGSLTGQFATVNLPSFDGGQFEAQYLATGLDLVTVPQ
jgi:hypothetical protein